MKLHFAASTHADLPAGPADKGYGQFNVEVADIIVVLGGDGQMLQAMWNQHGIICHFSG